MRKRGLFDYLYMRRFVNEARAQEFPNIVDKKKNQLMHPRVTTDAATSASLYNNLYRQGPYDYDLGGQFGPPITYAAGDAEVCIPIKMYSQAVVSQFQFVLRFGSSILECSSLSCGTFTPGSAWIAFGDKVAYSPDACADARGPQPLQCRRRRHSQRQR